MAGKVGRKVPATGCLLRPDANDQSLTAPLRAVGRNGEIIDSRIIAEHPLRVSLNGRKIVTLMTIGDHPDLLAIGHLLNQGLLKADDTITDIAFDSGVRQIDIRIARDAPRENGPDSFGGAAGTAYDDLLEELEQTVLDADAVLRTSWLHTLQQTINATPSLYETAGAIHGCVLCRQDTPLVYVEELGRHNAIDKVAGCMFLNGTPPQDKILYSTGRLTHGMVIKSVKMGIPIMLSRSGFTGWGVEIARQFGLTLVGRVSGKRFIVVSGENRVIDDFDEALAAG